MALIYQKAEQSRSYRTLHHHLPALKFAVYGCAALRQCTALCTTLCLFGNSHGHSSLNTQFAPL